MVHTTKKHLHGSFLFLVHGSFLGGSLTALLFLGGGVTEGRKKSVHLVTSHSARYISQKSRQKSRNHLERVVKHMNAPAAPTRWASFCTSTVPRTLDDLIEIKQAHQTLIHSVSRGLKRRHDECTTPVGSDGSKRSTRPLPHSVKK